MEVNPLSIILVKSDSKGDRLLFRYPIEIHESSEPPNAKKKNPYALPNVEDLLQAPPQPVSNISKGQLTGISDEVLSSMFAVKQELCDKKFELKINDVRFVSHPTRLPFLMNDNKNTSDKTDKKGNSSLILINFVFALQALASHSVVKCYHDLSKRIGIALRHEERRCGYLFKQAQIMTLAHDEGYTTTNIEPQNAFQTILEKCTLAQNMKKIYDDLCSTGLVNVRINRWIPLTFCLPQKVHQWHLRGKIIEPEDIDRCLQALRPYHSLLLLYSPQEISNFPSIDGSPTLLRLLSQYSPLKNLQTLASDADLTLQHVFDLTAHLVYWAKATVIFPVCSTNKYVIAPDAPIHLNSPLVDKFNEAFPGMDLIKVISEFSLPTSLGQKCNPLHHPTQQTQLVQMIIWMLQHHLLLQLHTYVQYMPTDDGLSKASFGSYNAKNHLKTPSPRNSTILMNSFQACASEHSRAESESGTSTISETPEPRSENELFSRSFLENMSFTSVEEEKADFQEELLVDFPDEERTSIFKIQATSHPQDLSLFARLCRNGYFQGSHHIEEIMYLENLRRSQLLQLLDKFRDVLITYETEDPAIAMFSCSSLY